MPPETQPAAAEPPVLHTDAVVQPVNAGPYLDVLEHRFGIAAACFDRYVIFRPNRDSLWIADRELQLPSRPPPHAIGFPFFYPNMDYPRPTTAAAVHFGPLATRNLVDMADDELSRLIHRKAFGLDDERLGGLDGNGYVLLRHRKLILGLGYFRPDESGAAITTLLPRTWLSRSSVPPPGDLDWPPAAVG